MTLQASVLMVDRLAVTAVAVTTDQAGVTTMLYAVAQSRLLGQCDCRADRRIVVHL